MKIGTVRSESDKVVYFVLLVCMTIIVAGCVMGVFYLQEYGFYTDKKGDDAKRYAVHLYSGEDVGFAKDYYFSSETDINHSEEIRRYKSNYYADRFSPDKSNFVFAVYNLEGELLFDSLNPEKDEQSETVFENAPIYPEFRGQSYFFVFDENSVPTNLTVKYGIIMSEKSNVEDRYSTAIKWIDIAYSLRYFVFVVLFIAVLFICFLLLAIGASAGQIDEETGEIVPGFIEKLPLDMLTVLTALLFPMASVIYDLTIVADEGMVLNNVVVMMVFVAVALILTIYVSTVSVRFKIYLQEQNKKTLRQEGDSR